MSLSHITFYVSNAKQVALYYCLQYGFKPFRYRLLENGSSIQASHAVINNDIIFVFVSPLNDCKDNQSMYSHIVRHGDAVKDVAFKVSSIDDLMGHIKKTFPNQKIIRWEESDENGCVRFATLAAFGDITHTLIESGEYPEDQFLPNWTVSSLKVMNKSIWALPTIDFLYVDHMAALQPIGKSLEVANWYKNILGFRTYSSMDNKMIKASKSNSGLRYSVVSDIDESIKFVINESAFDNKDSHIQRYLNFNGGPGFQHIAFYTEDICQAVSRLRDRGVKFCPAPYKYYEQLEERLKGSNLVIKHEISTLKKWDILLDFDQDGYLLQIFTEPVQDRLTLFFELIERHEFKGFGAGNVKALYDSIES